MLLMMERSMHHIKHLNNHFVAIKLPLEIFVFVSSRILPVAGELGKFFRFLITKKRLCSTALQKPSYRCTWLKQCGSSLYMVLNI